MDPNFFAQKIVRLYAIFGKPAPKAEALNVIWERVQDLPDGVMHTAEDLLFDEEKLPGNVGQWIVRVAVPEFYERNPGMRGGGTGGGCPDCDEGYYTLISPDGYSTWFACPCNRAPIMKPVRKADALRAGWKEYKRQPMPVGCDAPTIWQSLAKAKAMEAW